VVFAAALAVYLWTAPHGLTWAHDSADGGDLITAALVSGVAHPSGYPTYTLLARLAAWLPWGAPAWRVTLLSALSGALAAALVAAVVQDTTAHRWYGATRVTSSHLPPIAAGLMLAFAPLLWRQATVAEVYALHACLAAALIWALLRWQQSGVAAWAAAAGLLCGLALGNHLTIVWLAPLAATWLLLGWRRHGQSWRPLAAFAGALTLGLLTYLYLPLAAAGDPPVNWGNPVTWSGFWWLVSGELYHPYVLGAPWRAAWAQGQALVAQIGGDFRPWGVLLALVGVAVIVCGRRRWIALAAALISMLLGLAWAAAYNSSDSQWTLMPTWVLIAIAAGVGLDAAVRRLAVTGRAGAWAGAALCLAVAAAPLVLYGPAQRHSARADRAAEDFVAHVLAATAPNALVVTAGDQAIFSLWYARYGLAQRPDLIPVSRDLWGLASYRATVARTHPELAGVEPPAAWPALIQQTARQRPVYLADAQFQATPPDVTALGLPVDAPFYLGVAPAPGGLTTGQLWRLHEVRPRASFPDAIGFPGN
jgi:hypothetical protein